MLGKITISEEALIWAKVKKILVKKGAKAACEALEKIRAEQAGDKAFNTKNIFSAFHK